ncbi:MAG: pyridinium-3,5-biscarboxylic acid mononucleotide synthase [Actinomycetota bacterium]|nr:pyridinium-3,5-biscarboxylic acid mononucleotide synthase [Actinomycetota bacterium]
MDRQAARALLTAVADGVVDVDAALDRLVNAPFDPLGAGYTDLGFARVDTHRALRTGDPEAVYGAGKSPAQAVEILRALRDAHPERPVLLTRAAVAMRAEVREAFGPHVTEDGEAQCVAVGPLPTVASGRVVVVSAGTSDGPVAAEAVFTARAAGAEVHRISDVGVAGLHRLVAERGTMEGADCLVVVAGMDGALPSAVGGLVGVPLVAVPTSVGYGASFGGVAALLAMLNSCAPGVAVVNIDNGFGAGLFAARVARRCRAGGALGAEAGVDGHG